MGYDVSSIIKYRWYKMKIAIILGTGLENLNKEITSLSTKNIELKAFYRHGAIHMHGPNELEYDKIKQLKEQGLKDWIQWSSECYFDKILDEYIESFGDINEKVGEELKKRIWSWKNFIKKKIYSLGGEKAGAFGFYSYKRKENRNKRNWEN